MASDDWISMHRKGYLLCRYIQTCLIFPLRWAGFPIKMGLNAQWEQLFLMYFDYFSTIYLILSPFLMIKCSLSGNTLYLRLLAMMGFDAIRAEYNCCISMTILVESLCGC